MPWSRGCCPSARPTSFPAPPVPVLLLRQPLYSLQNVGCRPVTDAERAARAMRQRDVAILDLHLRMRFAAELTHRFEDLGDAAAIDRVVVAEAAAIGVERQFADARDQVAVSDELSALALLAEAEV